METTDSSHTVAMQRLHSLTLEPQTVSHEPDFAFIPNVERVQRKRGQENRTITSASVHVGATRTSSRPDARNQHWTRLTAMLTPQRAHVPGRNRTINP
jgi:hypothetical protein